MTTARYRPLRLAQLLAVLTACLGLLLASISVSTASPEELQSCSEALGRRPTISTDVLDTQLGILSWNIKKASRPGWADDLASLTAGVQLAFIQEASMQAGIPAAFTSPLHAAFAAGYSTGKQQTGVMTLSAAAPSLHCNFTSTEPWLRTPKATNITEYSIRGRQDRLLAINLHAVNFAMGVADFQAQIQALENLLVRHQGPVIFAGDFNTWSGRRQALVDEFLGTHALQPVQFTPDHRTRVFGAALDHIYVRGLRTHSAKVVEVSSSDHNPLRVNLEFL